MLEIKGQYGKDCKIFIDEVEASAMSTIYSILNHPVSDGKKVRIMPDVHDGAGIVIGFTMPLGNMVNPEHIGVDIGCAILMAKLPKLAYSLEEMNNKIREAIPMGFSHRSESYFSNNIPESLNGLEAICAKLGLDFGSVMRQIGTLGSGNHFIESGLAEKSGDMWLSIHSGSRNFGLQVCKYHVAKANNKSMPYLTGEAMLEYLNDMAVAQNFAMVNRSVILAEIKAALGIPVSNKLEVFETMHNYIDLHRNVIRKGAVSAEVGEMLVIPMNMRDGILLCVGKGNADWNYSAPHGAGRILSRGGAKRQLSLVDFEATMSGIYSTSVNQATLDESPFAYKDMNTIIECIKDTVDVVDIVKPILNIKA